MPSVYDCFNQLKDKLEYLSLTWSGFFPMNPTADVEVESTAYALAEKP
jgi:hypothetical protein